MLKSLFSPVSKNFIRSISFYNRQLFDKISVKDLDELDRLFEMESDVHTGVPIERCVNEVTLLGRAGKNPVLVFGMNQKQYVKFDLATRSLRVDKERGTDWHEVVCYEEKLRDYIAENVKVGDRLFIQGILNYLKPPPQLDIPYSKARILARKVIIVKRRRKQDEATDT